MQDNKQNLLEQKIQRLEDLLTQWNDENNKRQQRLEKRLTQGIIKYVCIVVAVLGAIWSVVELADWYWQNHKLAQLAQSYSQAADEGYRQSFTLGCDML